MEVFILNQLGITILTSIACSIAATFIVLGIQDQCSKRKLRKLYHEPLHEKTFNAHFKNDEKKETVYSVTIYVKKNIIEFSGRMTDIHGFPMNGRITMDAEMRDYGKGYYFHQEPTTQGFGFIEAQYQRTKNQFYVHQTYYHSPNHSESNARYYAYVWEEVKAVSNN
jgi:hypothetical protein